MSEPAFARSPAVEAASCRRLCTKQGEIAPCLLVSEVHASLLPDLAGIERRHLKLFTRPGERGDGCWVAVAELLVVFKGGRSESAVMTFDGHYRTPGDAREGAERALRERIEACGCTQGLSTIPLLWS